MLLRCAKSRYNESRRKQETKTVWIYIYGKFFDFMRSILLYFFIRQSIDRRFFAHYISGFVILFLSIQPMPST